MASMDVKAIAVIKKNSKKNNTKGCVKVMKAHKYWSVGALITMIGTFYTGYKGSKPSHRYFACSALICMIMSMYTGHKMISGNKRTRKQVKKTEAEES